MPDKPGEATDVAPAAKAADAAGADTAGVPVQAADSPERWRQVRAVLTANRPELSRIAAGLYPGLVRVGSTDLLSRAEWLPDAPLRLDDLPLAWVEQPPPPALDLTGPVSAHVRPVAEAGGRYTSYAEAVAALDRPGLFEDRPCYRLLGAALAGPRALRLTRTSYFAGMELGHSVAHELAAAWDESRDGLNMAALPLRSLAGDPCALDRRLSLCAVTTLTLRRAAGGRGVVRAALARSRQGKPRRGDVPGDARRPVPAGHQRRGGRSARSELVEVHGPRVQ